MDVYEVTYEREYKEKKKGAKRWSANKWEVETDIWVLANGDVRQAIRKAESHVRSQKQTEYDDGDSVMLERTVGFRATGAKHVGTIDVR